MSLYASSAPRAGTPHAFDKSATTSTWYVAEKIPIGHVPANTRCTPVTASTCAPKLRACAFAALRVDWVHALVSVRACTSTPSSLDQVAARRTCTGDASGAPCALVVTT